MIDMQLADRGEIELPYVHDGFVVGLRLEGHLAGITIEIENGKRVELLMHGVRALQIDHFRLGNIVFSARIFRNVRPSRADMANILKGLRPLDSGQWEHDVGYPETIASEVEQGRAILCIIEPTIGCSMTALCERVEMAARGLGRERPAQQTAWN